MCATQTTEVGLLALTHPAIQLKNKLKNQSLNDAGPSTALSGNSPHGSSPVPAMHTGNRTR
jgi:hypothetical protein